MKVMSDREERNQDRLLTYAGGSSGLLVEACKKSPTDSEGRPIDGWVIAYMLKKQGFHKEAEEFEKEGMMATCRKIYNELDELTRDELDSDISLLITDPVFAKSLGIEFNNLNFAVYMVRGVERIKSDKKSQ